MVGQFTAMLDKIGFGSKKASNQKLPTISAGTSGTEIFAGRFDEEYLIGLMGEDAIKKYDEMRRSDGQIKMLLSVVKNPIKSASWSIEPYSDDPRDVEIANFAKHIMFKDIASANGRKKKKFNELISEILTCIEFGYSIFERVHKVVRGHPVYGDYIGYADIGFRHQRSIQEWVLDIDGSIQHVRQLVNGDLSVHADISGEHISVFTIEKEGDNYEGISMLRPCYGAWYRKNTYRKYQAIGIERGAMSVLHGEVDPSIMDRSDGETQRKVFETVLNQISTHQKNAIVSAAGMKINEIKLSHDAEKVQGVINSENIEMSKAFLVTFMEMGLEHNGGSYSLGSDLSGIFLSGIDYIGDMITDKINEEMIEPIVRAKYGILEGYPMLKHKGINDKAGKEFSDIMKSLKESDLIQSSDRLKAYMHDRYDLPEFDPELEEEIEEEDNTPPENEPEPEPDDVDDTKMHDCCHDGFDAAYSEISEPILLSYDGDMLSRFEQIKLDEMIYDAARTDIRLANVLPSVFIARNAEKLQAILTESMIERSDKMIDTMINIYKRTGDRSKVLQQRMPEAKKLKDTLKVFTGDLGQQALTNVLKELGRSRSDTRLSEEFKDLPSASKEKLLQEILLLAGFLDSDMEKVVLFSFNGSYDKTDSAAAINKELKRQRDKFIAGQSIRAAATNMSSKTVNTVRNEVFSDDEILSDIESFIFMNPSPESAICQNLTGRVFSKEEYEASEYLPPLHHNCKSYIMAQTVGKKTNKPVDPKGLSLSGSDEEIEKAIKSKSL